MLDSRFIYLALSFNVLGASLYVRKSLRNEIQPHVVTFLLWALVPLLAFVAQLADHVGQVSFLTLIVGLNPAVILAVSLRKSEAHWNVTRFDIVCGALSVLGLAAWGASRQAAYAIAFSIMADLLASLPTYRKSIRAPSSESPVLYICLAISSGITLMTIRQWTFSHCAFALYLFALGFSLSATIIVGEKAVRHPARSR